MDPTDLPDAGEDVDLMLRHVSRQFPEDFARAILPPGMHVSSATWLETQVTSRQRRLDRVLDVVADGQRRLEHTEWQLEWQGDVPLRLFEYHFMLALAVANETTDKKGPPPIRSTLVLLSGRDLPWPATGQYRTSPPREPFTGVLFRIEAVYQQTVAELEARASPLWLIFAPLAIDADAAAMSRVVATMRERSDEREFEELVVALTVMADMDRRQRGLKSAIVPLLSEEMVMESWIYKQGEARGRANALLRVLQARAISVPDEARQRILMCDDTAQIETWLDRAAVARSIDEVVNGAGAHVADS